VDIIGSRVSRGELQELSMENWIVIRDYSYEKIYFDRYRIIKREYPNWENQYAIWDWGVQEVLCNYNPKLGRLIRKRLESVPHVVLVVPPGRNLEGTWYWELEDIVGEFPTSQDARNYLLNNRISYGRAAIWACNLADAQRCVRGRI
jgi:hypothetical protein